MDVLLALLVFCVVLYVLSRTWLRTKTQQKDVLNRLEKIVSDTEDQNKELDSLSVGFEVTIAKMEEANKDFLQTRIAHCEEVRQVLSDHIKDIEEITASSLDERRSSFFERELSFAKSMLEETERLIDKYKSQLLELENKNEQHTNTPTQTENGGENG